MTVPPPDQELADIRARFERTVHPDWRDDTDIGRLLAEVDRLRAELARYEALELGDTTGRISASCPNGQHPTWLRRLTDHDGCPWCENGQLRSERDQAHHAGLVKAAGVLDDIAGKQDCFDDQQSQADAEHTRSSARAIRIYAAATADAPKPAATVPGVAACHSTRHCVTWGFCHRCAPELSAQASQRLGEAAGNDRSEVYAAIVAGLTGAETAAGSAPTATP
jgi:hypothetical protein